MPNGRRDGSTYHVTDEEKARFATDGYVHRDGAPSVEDVADHWATINDETGYFVPTDLMDWSAAFTAHLES